MWLGVWLPGWIFFVLSTLSAQPLYGQKVKVTAESVETAIENGVNYLLSKQDPISGKWAGHEDQGCGQTALVVLALLNCMKDGAKHPKVAKAIEYLRSVEPKRTYECALHCMVLCTANPKRDAELIRRDIAFLVETQLQGEASLAAGPIRFLEATPIRRTVSSHSLGSWKRSAWDSPCHAIRSCMPIPTGESSKIAMEDGPIARSWVATAPVA